MDLKRFYTNNAISFTKGWKDFSFSPKIGLQFESQNLSSGLFTSDNLILADAYSNDLDWERSKVYFHLQTQYKKARWRFRLETPLNLHSYAVEDSNLRKSQNLNQLTFDPRFSIIYDINTFWKVNASTSVGKQFGTIDQLYYGFILRDYRSIQRVDTPLSEAFNQNVSGGISYRNPIKSLFWNLLYTHSITAKNLLYNTMIMEGGASEIQAVPVDNNHTNNNLSARLSKYFDTLKTNATLTSNYSSQNFQQILNSELADIKSRNWSLGGKVDADLTNWLNAEYKVDSIFSKNKIQESSNQTILHQNHILDLNFTPTDNLFLGLKSEYIQNTLFSENSENIFMDLIGRYSWKDRNIDFEVQLSNLFNTKIYRTVNIDAFSYVETEYQLRPSQILFKMRFSL